ncbi:hypothetical protein L0337_12030 [candidate division KSB1 bacterium]|nr:hypothetical protein [candidate division KSB1 bacterium]
MSVVLQKRKRKILTLFDSGALITSAKFHVRGRLIVDYLIDCCRITIPPEVKYETVDMGLLFGYQDAEDLSKRLNAGHFLVFLPDLVLLLVNKGWMKTPLAMEILETIQPRYAKGFIELALKLLKGVI